MVRKSIVENCLDVKENAAPPILVERALLGGILGLDNFEPIRVQMNRMARVCEAHGWRPLDAGPLGARPEGGRMKQRAGEGASRLGGTGLLKGPRPELFQRGAAERAPLLPCCAGSPPLAGAENGAAGERGS